MHRITTHLYGHKNSHHTTAEEHFSNKNTSNITNQAIMEK
jgi:hypothetical protein